MFVWQVSVLTSQEWCVYPWQQKADSAFHHALEGSQKQDSTTRLYSCVLTPPALALLTHYGLTICEKQLWHWYCSHIQASNAMLCLQEVQNLLLCSICAVDKWQVGQLRSLRTPNARKAKKLREIRSKYIISFAKYGLHWTLIWNLSYKEQASEDKHEQ